MNFSRPNITYTIGRLSRYTHSPDHDHWEALVRLMIILASKFDIKDIGEASIIMGVIIIGKGDSILLSLLNKIN